MDNTIQLYSDREKKNKVYPMITSTGTSKTIYGRIILELLE